ncbi:MAG: M56 family metallopeptidase [Candidatus Eremiobacteraeota bacterium]|nr:M56 family metallopeptidase [Candidatus Eremiobacteraeota bacterium]
MADLMLFLHACNSAGMLLTSLCGLILMPFAAWAAIRRLTPYIVRMTDDTPWQAPLASIAATIPGALFLSLAAIGLAGASSSGCLNFLWGRILFGTILSLTLVAITRASSIAASRGGEVRRLIRLSEPPSRRIQGIAARAEVCVRVLNYARPFCALARIFSPLVVISRGTVERLNDDELGAALRHERAHAVRGDLLLAAALHFFVDLLPLPAKDLIDTYAGARELAADQHASRHASREDLASAILSLAGSKKLAPSFASLAEDQSGVRPRVMALLEARAQRSGPAVRRLVVTGALLAIVGLSFSPVVLSAAPHHACAVTQMGAPK